MAVCSLAMDLTITNLQRWHVEIIDYVEALDTGPVTNYIVAFFVWTLFAVGLVLASASFVHYIAPQAIGSGIPEMKTILRGVVLKEYLTFRTLLAKMVGLTGRDVASVVGNLLTQLIRPLHGAYANESRSYELLAAACAVGVSSTFSAPFGGVLFSIEVTSVYFAVRNYWRGVFAAGVSAMLLSLMKAFTETEVTVVAFYQTSFPTHESYFPEEIPIFAFIGIICGLLSALFICLQRKIILFLRCNKRAKRTFQKHWLLYPLLISSLVASVTFPKGFGRFMVGEKSFSNLAKDFFIKCTWSALANASNRCDEDFLHEWTGPGGEYSIFTTLYPNGVHGPEQSNLYPGLYAVVGSAAFCGGVTHTVSVAVIVFELTGQVLFILPVMVAVLIANAVCSYFQPSIYDSAIKLKHLPFIPNIPPSTSNTYHAVQVDQFMIKSVSFLSLESTYKDVQAQLLEAPHVKSFPIVEKSSNSILIGSCSRWKLMDVIDTRIGVEARQLEAKRRQKDIQEAQFRTNIENVGLKAPKAMSAKHRCVSMGHLTENGENGGMENIEHTKLGRVNSLDYGRKKTKLDRAMSIKAQFLRNTLIHRTFSWITPRKSFSNKVMADLYGSERANWEYAQLSVVVDFEELGIDPAPFQLVEHCSLFKVHSLFSLLGLSRAYVTRCGRLVGVVALKDLRLAVEMVQSGQLSAESPAIPDNLSMDNLNKTFSRHSLKIKEDEENIRNDVLTVKFMPTE
ncbi:voltage gated chloride channel domain-containing protein [Ditylenchus destructor]|uniref:Voltage gated chloride channel domain-containing protein n=1 Tax=Ditylenchus destructor TaxID=166010 RepID=A0AAD4QZQ2_9BILA|nr:voltage gated chloride channel domain-containing protein [Ditylenchus destructor]